MIHFDTIAAPATAPGIAATATIRVSGPDAIAVVDRIWRGHALADTPANTMRFGYILDSDGSEIDQTVAAVFRAPHSFTGLDTVEITSHGSPYITRRILDALVAAGARIAGPGEFTRYAFLNGKIDLTQAEGIADLIAADSRAAHSLALRQTKGRLADLLKDLRSELTDLAALLELELDFSEEDVTFADRSQLRRATEKILASVTRLADSYRAGRNIRDGIPVAIAGVPNAGKSTLLNAILGHDRAIVSDTPGTTRDTIEEKITLGNYSFRFIDTAGIRKTDDPLEQLGIDRTNNALSGASQTVWLIDPTAPLDTQLPPLLAHFESGADVIIAVTKTDLADPSETIAALRQTFEQQHLPTPEIISLSAADASTIDTLITRITDTAGATHHADLAVTNARHAAALTAARAPLTRLLSALTTSNDSNPSNPQIETIETIYTTDLMAQDLREALHHLSEITGEITTDTLLATIFSRFCIGK